MWCENFKDVWKGLTLGQRPNYKSSNLIRESSDHFRGFTEICEEDISLPKTFVSWHFLELPMRWPKKALKSPHRSIDPGCCLSCQKGAHHLSEAHSHDCSLSAWCDGVRVCVRSGDYTQRQQA